MKVDFKRIFKVIFLISSIPVLIILYMVYENKIFSSIFEELLLSLIVLNVIIISDSIKNIEYRKHKIENPEKRKIIYPILYLAIFSIFYVPKLLFGPMLSSANNLLLYVGILMLFIAFFLFYSIFIYKLIRDFENNPKALNPFKRSYIDHMDLIKFELEKINVYQKMLVGKNRLIVINRSGIYEFINFDKRGILIGNITNKYWEFNDKNINNPFLLVGNNIQNYFITNTKTKFTLQGIGIVSRAGITPLMEKNLQNNIFDNKKIDKIYNELEELYGHNKD